VVTAGPPAAGHPNAGYPVRGQVWEYVQGSHQYRILVVSNDEYNELPGAIPWALVLERGADAGPGGIPGYLVELTGDDPLPGAVVLVPRVMRCDTTALRRCLGFVADQTMAAVERGLREFLNLR
jgi:mRNA-degrading endonuclease toxin of MazEF toxin-antitoxin module